MTSCSSLSEAGDDLVEADELSGCTVQVCAMLAEIRDAVGRLAGKGETHVIDLRSLPLSQTERRQLRAALGDGEVSAQVTALGETHVQETAVAGVWWIRHHNTTGEVMTELVEVVRVPGILEAQTGDIDEAFTRLQQRIDTLGCGNTEGGVQ